MLIFSLSTFVVHKNHERSSTRPPIFASNCKKTIHANHSLLILPLSCHATHLGILTFLHYRVATNYLKPLVDLHRSFLPSLALKSPAVRHTRNQPFQWNNNLSTIFEFWSYPHISLNPLLKQTVTNNSTPSMYTPQLGHHLTNRNTTTGRQRIKASNYSNLSSLLHWSFQTSHTCTS